MERNKTKIIMLLLAAVFMLSACSSVEKDYWENGNLKSELPYKGGKLNGTARWYYEDGTIQLEVHYVDDVIHGPSTRYHDNGRKETEENYEHGLRQGMAVEYSYAGVRAEKMFYVNDTLHGPYRKWHGNKELQISGEFVNGLFDGTWLYFDDYGELIGEGKYKAGSGVQRFWNRDGSLRSRTTYVNNLKHGKEYHYTTDGSLDYVVEYEYDELVTE